MGGRSIFGRILVFFWKDIRWIVDLNREQTNCCEEIKIDWEIFLKVSNSVGTVESIRFHLWKFRACSKMSIDVPNMKNRRRRFEKSFRFLSRKGRWEMRIKRKSSWAHLSFVVQDRPLWIFTSSLFNQPDIPRNISGYILDPCQFPLSQYVWFLPKPNQYTKENRKRVPKRSHLCVKHCSEQIERFYKTGIQDQRVTPEALLYYTWNLLGVEKSAKLSSAGF